MSSSKRNSLAGTKRGKSKTAKYYQDNSKARKKKDAYNKKYNSTPASKAKRAELGKLNRKLKSKKGDGKDVSHLKNGKVKLESQSKNRGRREKSRLRKRGK